MAPVRSSRAVIVVGLLSGAATAQEAVDPWDFEATVSAGAKYDDNLALTSQEDPVADPQSDVVGAFGAAGRMRYAKGRWDLDGGLRLRAELPTEQTRLRRFAGDIDMYWAFDITPADRLQFAAEQRCFLEPDVEIYDHCRSYAAQTYRRIFSPSWQLHLGTDTLTSTYVDNTALEYSATGFFVELRNPWTTSLATWLRSTTQLYHGGFRAQSGDEGAAPENGHRNTLELGLDWRAGPRLSLLSALRLQSDVAPESELREVESSKNRDDGLETDAAFNFRNARATTLVSWLVHRRLSWAAYGEVMVVSFVEGGADEAAREDLRILGSSWLKLRLTDGGLAARLRYIFRFNESNVDAEAYQNHIVYLGLEQRW